MWSLLHQKYSRIYPLVKNIRGATRIKEILKDKAFSKLPQINEEPTLLYDLDFDSVIILDACRYDLYKVVTGSEDYRISTGSSSEESIKKNFSNHDWSDTVLITANPHFNEDIFHKITGKELGAVFHTVFKAFETDWNDEEGTILPESVSKKVLTAEKLFPEKKKVIWYMQPHHPFINSEIQDQGFSKNLGTESRDKVWDLARKGVYSDEEIWSAYKENLKLVLDEIKENILPELSGRTIITSDHGNLVGEQNLYAHPSGKKAKYLRKVPLDIINN